jgi:Cellulase (glycosyl hydrolase family 5)
MMMSRRFISRIGFALAILLTLTGAVLAQNPMVHRSGTKLVDGSGKPVYLRGVLLEGWLQWIGVISGSGLTSETHMLEELTKLVGPEETERFRQATYAEFTTEADIQAIAALGLNTVRVPINHRAIEQGQSGWQHLDNLMTWCERHNVYVMLELHSAPGGQTGLFVGDPDKKLLWDSKEDEDHTVELWRRLATRYKDKKIVVAYDLLNEPDAPFLQAHRLPQLYDRITAAIREVDPYHFILIEGANPCAADFSMFKNAPKDDNTGYSFHTYNLLGDDAALAQVTELKKLSDRHNVPIVNGEFGAHTALWTKTNVHLFEQEKYGVSGWIFWPWKRAPQIGAEARFLHLNAIQLSPNAKKVMTWIAAPGWSKKPSRAETLQGLRDYLEASKASKLVPNQEMVKILSPLQ